MNRTEFYNKTKATSRQVYYWMEQKVPFDGQGRGSGHAINYSEMDVEVADLLAKLSTLMGIGNHSLNPLEVMRNVSSQLRRWPEYFELEYFYVDRKGNLSKEPVEGWVLFKE